MGHLWLLSTVVSRLFACMAVCVFFSTQQKHVCISLYVPEYACLCVYEGVCVWVCVYQCSECARAHFLLLLQMESPADSSADQTCLDLKCILRCLVSLLREALLLQTELIAGTHRVCLPLRAPWGRSGEGGREGVEMACLYRKPRSSQVGIHKAKYLWRHNRNKMWWIWKLWGRLRK